MGQRVGDEVTPEQWAPIAGHDGYEVSDCGRVRSIARTHVVKSRWGHEMSCALSGRVLKTWLVGAGYPMVGLGFARHKRRYVHHLVAEAFVVGREPGREVNHFNGNKQDNSASNLEWVTRSQNNKHATHVLGHRAGQFGPGRQRVCA